MEKKRQGLVWCERKRERKGFKGGQRGREISAEVLFFSLKQKKEVKLYLFSFCVKRERECRKSIFFLVLLVALLLVHLLASKVVHDVAHCNTPLMKICLDDYHGVLPFKILFFACDFNATLYLF